MHKPIGPQAEEPQSHEDLEREKRQQEIAERAGRLFEKIIVSICHNLAYLKSITDRDLDSLADRCFVMAERFHEKEREFKERSHK